MNDQDFMREWTTDAYGNRVRVGLSKEETSEYEALQGDLMQKRRDARAPDEKARDRWLQLADKHELARLAAITAEAELRQKPTIN